MRRRNESVGAPSIGLRWYTPSLHGDIMLESIEGGTSVRAFQLSPSEEAAMAVLRRRALAKPLIGKAWATEADFRPLAPETYRTAEGVTIRLKAPIEKVQAILAGAMKPGAKLLHAVRFSDGSIAEAKEIKGKDGEPAVEVPKKLDKAKPKAGATVAEPTIGCPSPLFEQAEIRASRVLEAFLDEEQTHDYRVHGAFVATGADTGHRYMVTHRERPNAMESVSFRSLYDLDERRALCVHDWTVPAPEEMLALFLCVTIPGKESAVRHLPETWHG
jgi:hypothetical protein